MALTDLWFHLSIQPTISSITPSIISIIYLHFCTRETFHLGCQASRKMAWDGPLGRLPSVWQRSCTDKTSRGQSDS